MPADPDRPGAALLEPVDPTALVRPAELNRDALKRQGVEVLWPPTDRTLQMATVTAPAAGDWSAASAAAVQLALSNIELCAIYAPSMAAGRLFTLVSADKTESVRFVPFHENAQDVREQ